MSNIDGLFNRSLVNSGKNAIESTKDDKGGGNNAAKARLLGNLLLAFLIICADGMMVIFRSNFGKKGINLTRTIICALCFGFVSYLLFDQNHLNFDIEDSPSNTISFFISGAIYAFLSVFIFIKGIFSFKKAWKENPYSDYKGDSSLFGFLEDYGYSPKLIQGVGEPLYTIIFGVLLYLYNPVGGMPMIFCGISLWLSVLFDLLVGHSSIDSMKHQLQATRTNDVITNEVSDQ